MLLVDLPRSVFDGKVLEERYRFPVQTDLSILSAFSERITIIQKILAKHGISGQKGVNNNYDKSPLHLPRQSIINVKNI